VPRGWNQIPVRSDEGWIVGKYRADKPERSVVYAPFRPFPRNVLHGGFTLLPRPPWFVSNTHGEPLGRLLTAFQHRPGWLKIPGIFLHALQG